MAVCAALSGLAACPLARLILAEQYEEALAVARQQVDQSQPVNRFQEQIQGYEMPFRALSTRTSCYGFRS